MFNKYLLALGLMTLSGTVLSAPPSASLRVSGSIIPPTCTLNGEEEETYTYNFKISPGIFPASGNFKLSPQSHNIEVICDATTYLTFTTTDERAGTEFATGINLYGLGTYGPDTKIGYFAVRMENITVKSSADASATSVGVLVNAIYDNSAWVSKNTVTGWATSASKLAAAQIFAADFTVTSYINNAMKNSAGDAELDGLAILTFAFGI